MVLFLAGVAPASTFAADITVYAAASLKNALDSIAKEYETAHPDDHIRLSYAGSSALAKQIMAGAPADVFISASTAWMDKVGDEKLLAPGTRRDLLTNTLVLIGHGAGTGKPADHLPDIPALLNGGKLAMALVDSVPAGVYGKEALTHIGQWDALSGQVAQAENVRAALALVATGEAPFGITYASDARAEPRVHIVAAFPPESHSPIVYPIAALAGSAEKAAPFMAMLDTDAAKAIFTREGFGVN